MRYRDTGSLPWLLLYAAYCRAQIDSGSQQVTGVCGTNNPCVNGACCAVAPGASSGYCGKYSVAFSPILSFWIIKLTRRAGYGPDYCSNNNLTDCISDCDGKAECGPNAVDAAHFACPLNVCCSQWGFCGTTDEFCGAGCTSGCAPPTEPNTNCAAGSSLNRVIGYYEGWAVGQPCDIIQPEELPVASYTHLYFSFASLDPESYAVVPASPSDVPLYTRITNLKAINPALRTYISIGGWTFNDPGPTFTTFSNLSSSPAHTMAFVTSLMNFMTQFGFDGVDIDWEYPAAPERGGSPVDTQNFVTLLSQIRAGFDNAGHRDWGITFTAPSSYFYMRNFDIPGMLEYADWVNVMTYDLHGTWDQNDIWIGPYLLAHTNLTEMEQTMQLFWRTGVPSTSVVLGIGFYGRSFTVSNPDCTQPGYYCTFSGGGKPGPCTASSGTLSYAEIMGIIAENDLVGVFDSISGAKYLNWDTNQWVSYDDAQTLALKVNFADQHCLGGIMIWSADQDTPEFDAINSLLGEKVLIQLDAAQVPFQTSILVPNGQNCAPTANCGDLCPNGFVQVNGANGPAYVPDGCDPSSPRKICCPSIATPSSCSWKGSGDCHNGYCSDGEVTVAVSKSGDGSTCRGDAGSHKEFCCSTDLSSNLLDTACQWSLDCGPPQCPANLPVLLTVAQGYPSCTSYGFPGGVQPLCCASNVMKNCAWHGDPAIGCTDNVCPAGQFRWGTPRRIVLTIANACSAVTPPVLRNFPFLLQIYMTTYQTNQPQCWITDGDSSDLTTMAISDWVVLDCHPTLEEAQNVRVFCTQDFQSSRCGELTASHTIDTIVLLPTTCSKGNYVRVAGFSESSDQTLSAKYHALKPANEMVYDMQFDYALDKIDVSLLTDEVVFRVDTSNIPGYWDQVVDKAVSRRSVDRRDLKKRWWGEFTAWLADMNTIDIPLVHTVDVAGPKNFDYPLYQGSLSCPTGLTATASVGVSGTLSIPINYGVIILGTLLPVPDVSESYVFMDASASASIMFYAVGQATLTYSSDVVNIFNQAVFGFSFPNVVTIGPAFVLDAYLTGQVTVAGNFAAGLKFTSQNYHFSVNAGSSSQENTTPATSPSVTSLVTPTFDVSASVAGSLSVHLVPRAQIGIEVGWSGTKAIQAVVAVSLDTSVTFGFDATTSTGGNSACIWGDANAVLYGGLSGSLLGTTLGGSANVTLYQSPAFTLFQAPGQCHSTTNLLARELEAPEDLFNEHNLFARGTPDAQCPGFISCGGAACSPTGLDSDCPGGCSANINDRRSLDDALTNLTERDTITGYGGSRDNVNICGILWSFPAIPKRGLTWFDYSGGLTSPTTLFQLGMQSFIPTATVPIPYVVNAGVSPTSGSYYEVEHVYVLGDFANYLFANLANSAAAICAYHVKDGMNELSNSIFAPGDATTNTGNAVMTPKYLNGFKYVAFAGHSAAPPASLSPDDALRKLKYFAALGYYMNDRLVNGLWEDTSKDVKAAWLLAANTISPQVAASVSTLYDTWLAAKIIAAQDWVVTSTDTYITHLLTVPVPQLCYGVTHADLTAYQTTFDNDIFVDDFGL